MKILDRTYENKKEALGYLNETADHLSGVYYSGLIDRKLYEEKRDILQAYYNEIKNSNLPDM